MGSHRSLIQAGLECTVGQGDALSFGIAFNALIIWSLINFPLSVVVVNDHRATERFAEAACSVGQLSNLSTYRLTPTCTQGTLVTCVSDVTGQCLPSTATAATDVRLHYPPISSWVLVCKTPAEVRKWAERIKSAAATATFECFVSTAGDGSVSGMSAPLEYAWLWKFDLALSSITLTMAAAVLYAPFAAKHADTLRDFVETF
eukprot:m.469511 g.469511  ORF g.469511 m.469511 type:complete len:203 (-) comp28637_c0_seq1:43-651(-)